RRSSERSPVVRLRFASLQPRRFEPSFLSRCSAWVARHRMSQRARLGLERSSPTHSTSTYWLIRIIHIPLARISWWLLHWLVTFRSTPLLLPVGRSSPL